MTRKNTYSSTKSASLKQLLKKTAVPVGTALLVVLLFSIALVAKDRSDLIQTARNAEQGLAVGDHDHGSTIPSCGLSNPAFCDTFDKPEPGGKAGDLDDSKWSVSRFHGELNVSSNIFNNWLPSKHNHCGTFTTVKPDNDFTICNNHYMDSFHDGQSYRWSSARARQPFDFAGRTGTATWEVDNKNFEHAWHTEFWITDEPVPGPYLFAHEIPPKNGVNIVFGNCHNAANPNLSTVHFIAVVKNYQKQPDSIQHPPFPGRCFSHADNVRNRFQVKINTNTVEVWATDAGGGELRKIAERSNLSLNFTRGYIHTMHTGYNAVKANPPQSPESTYHWDSVGFDGPVLPATRGYDIPTAKTPVSDGSINLGYVIVPKGIQTSIFHNPQSIPNFTFNNVNTANVKKAYLTTIVAGLGQGRTLLYRLNSGEWRSFTNTMDTPSRTLALPIPVSEIRSGTNTLEMKAATLPDHSVYTASDISLELELIDSAPIAPTPVPTHSNMTPIPTHMHPTATPVVTLAPTNTPIATIIATKSPTPSPTAIPVNTATPIPTPSDSPAGNTAVSIRAAGTHADGIYPNLSVSLKVNNTRQIIYTKEGVQGNPSSNTYETLIFNYPGIIKVQELRFEFTNDALNRITGQDRNLFIESVTVNGQTYQPTAGTTLSTGTWGGSNGCGVGFKRSQTLHCNGYFIFDL